MVGFRPSGRRTWYCLVQLSPCICAPLSTWTRRSYENQKEHPLAWSMREHSGCLNLDFNGLTSNYDRCVLMRSSVIYWKESFLTSQQRHIFISNLSSASFSRIWLNKPKIKPKISVFLTLAELSKIIILWQRIIAPFLFSSVTTYWKIYHHITISFINQLSIVRNRCPTIQSKPG